MGKQGWLVVGLGVLFVIIQSCGDTFGTGMIMTPEATVAMTQARPEPTAYETADGGWAPYVYDDGAEYWDGGAPMVLEEWHWNQGVSNFRGQLGQRFEVHCIEKGSEYAVWGSNPYTDDSPVCTAGAHLGLIDRLHGGTVTIEIRPAQKSYNGVIRNGVTGFAWGPYPGSYVVLTR